jgi:hypothetical protein
VPLSFLNLLRHTYARPLSTPPPAAHYLHPLRFSHSHSLSPTLSTFGSTTVMRVAVCVVVLLAWVGLCTANEDKFEDYGQFRPDVAASTTPTTGAEAGLPARTSSPQVSSLGHLSFRRHAENADIPQSQVSAAHVAAAVRDALDNRDREWRGRYDASMQICTNQLTRWTTIALFATAALVINYSAKIIYKVRRWVNTRPRHQYPQEASSVSSSSSTSSYSLAGKVKKHE